MRGRPRLRGLAEDRLAACGFLLPLVAVAAVFVAIPIAGTVWTSLVQDVSYLPSRFVGAANYKRLLADHNFWRSLRFTLLFVAVSVPLELALGVIFALILNEKLRLRGLLRAAVLIPWAVPTVVAARTWELIYNYSYGLANWLAVGTGLAAEPLNWLGTAASAFSALVVADVWKTTPFVAIIVLAGLQTVPEEIYEQAKVDGARLHQRFFKITLPVLKPVIAVALVFRTIDAVRVLDLIYVVTGGGPGGATTSMSLYGYRFFNEGDFGYGSTIAVAVFVIALALSAAYLKAGQFGRALQ
ncbi:MAG: sugar ABC transporter permease [bacterium]